MKLTGKVQRKKLFQGTKSEHEGLVLMSPEGAFKLKRRGGNPFWDEALAGLEGKEIEAEGLLKGNQFIMAKWKVLG